MVYKYTLSKVAFWGIISLFEKKCYNTSMLSFARAIGRVGYIALSSKTITKVLGVVALFCLNLNVYSQEDYKQEVISLVEQAKKSIAKKDYITARRILDGSLVYGVYKDSIEYYLQFIDYQIELDDVESLYQKKRFQKTREEYDKLYHKHKNVIKTIPNWILRCDTIINAQKKGNAVTREIASKEIWQQIKSPKQSLVDGYFFAYADSKELSFIVFSKNFNICSTFNYYVDVFKCGLSKAYGGYRIGRYNGIVYINHQGKIHKFDYEWGSDFSEGLAVVKNKKGYCGYIDTTGKEVIKCQFIAAWPFSEGLARVVMENEYGNLVYAYINKTGNIVIKGGPSGVNFSEKYNFSEGFAFDNINDCIDKHGNKVFSCKREYKIDTKARAFPHQFSCGLACVALGEDEYTAKFGFIDRTGEEVISLKYDFASDFSEDFSWVRKGDKMGCINRQGFEAIPFVYDAISDFVIEHNEQYKFKEGLACVKMNDKWGYVDYTGKVVIPFEFEDAWGFSEGFAWVKKSGKWGVVDKFGISTFDYQ